MSILLPRQQPHLIVCVKTAPLPRTARPTSISQERVQASEALRIPSAAPVMRRALHVPDLLRLNVLHVLLCMSCPVDNVSHHAQAHNSTMGLLALIARQRVPHAHQVDASLVRAPFTCRGVCVSPLVWLGTSETRQHDNV